MKHVVCFIVVLFYVMLSGCQSSGNQPNTAQPTTNNAEQPSKPVEIDDTGRDTSALSLEKANINTTVPEFKDDAEYLRFFNTKYNEIVVEDIFSPTVGTRVLTYPQIAMYETLRFSVEPNLPTFTGKLNGLTTLPQPQAGQTYDYTLAAVTAFCEVGRTLIWSKHFLKEAQDNFTKQRSAKTDPAVAQRSVAYGVEMAKAINDWKKGDNYAQTRGMQRHMLNLKDPAAWIPTPPLQLAALEPNWLKVRPLTLDSASQFIPQPPVKFDTIKGSAFYKESYEVYNAGKKLNPEQKEMALFWDNNPNGIRVKGHLNYFIKKISPTGHWLGIVGILTRDKKMNAAQTAQTYAYAGIALFDAFISCWDEKYRSYLLRPETFINLYIDPDWAPLIQTPPFPEHTSGHSVASSAVAYVLTQQFGKNMAFTDNALDIEGLTPRKFKSIQQAADEACISRLYGGIHFRRAIEAGQVQGKKVGENVWKKLTGTTSEKK